MKSKVTIKEMTISNFKGQNRQLSFGEHENKITGKNRAGKSTIMKAFTWLLTGSSDAYTPQNSDLFDNTKEITKDTPPASVSVLLSINDTEYKIERIAKAKFTRKRGSDVYEKAASDEYKYLIDDVEYTSKDFNKWLSDNICDTEFLEYVISGHFFINLATTKKQDARVLLSKIIGNVTVADLSGSYPHVRENIGTLTLEQIAAQASNRAKSLKERIEQIPTLIDDKEREKSELEQTDFDYVLRQIELKKNEIDDIDKTILGESAAIKPVIDAINKAKQERKTYEDMLDNEEKKYNAEYEEQLFDLQKQINKIKSDNSLIESRNNAKQAILDSHKKRLEELKKERVEVIERRDHLRVEKDEIKNKVFEGTHCSFCGQELPQDKLNEAMEHFNNEKESQLKTIVSRGKAANETIKKYDDEINNLEAVIAKGIELETEKNTSDYELQIEQIKKNHVQFRDTGSYELLKKKVDSVIIPELPESNPTELTNKKREINSELEDLNRKYGLKSRVIECEKTIESLKQEQIDKGVELASYEKQVQEVADCKQEMMEVLSNRVNQKLNYSRIDIWSTQKSGAVVPDLIIKDEHGINYATTNGASRLTIAVDLQHFFSEALDVQLPYFVDESSIMNEENLPRFEDSQMFYMYCTEDEELKIESF